jgi:lipopolysaccharide/colanic/teichoic acid biosynthesis glycosyltransferase
MNSYFTQSSAAGSSTRQKSKRNVFKHKYFRWFWYLVGLPVIVLLSGYVTWGKIAIPLKALFMITMMGTLYIGLLINRYQADDHRSYRTFGLSIFYTSVGYLAIFALLALFRLYYSRTFLLSSYVFVAGWILMDLLFMGKHHPNYLIISGGIADKIKNIKRRKWDIVNKLPSTNSLLAYDGIVIDLHVHEDENHVLNALANASLHDVAIIHAASVLEQYRGQTDLDYVAEEGLYDLSSHKIYPATKRGIEVLFTLLLSPFILLIAAVAAAAVKVSSKGPVIYSQDRIGRNGKFFTLYKFRSMTMGSERYGPQFAVKQDKRVTKVGTFIRKFRIDEIPQFWNVLKGDMSLIGPRPEQKMFVELFNDEIPFYSYRHKVRPGITGWAQIKDGYADGVKSTKRKLEYDFYYIKNLSFSLDLLIIYATIKTILTGFGSR